MKNNQPESGAGIQTDDFLNVSLLPLQLDQSYRLIREFFKWAIPDLFLFIFVFSTNS